MAALLRKVLTILFGMTLVSAGNYAVNILYGRYLDSATLGDVILVTTCLLVLGALSLALQTATARAVAARGALGTPESALRRATRLAIHVGIGLAVFGIAFSKPLAGWLKLSSRFAFVWLAVLAPLILYQGVRRGKLQGEDRTLRFTATFQAEMGVRLIVTWLALALGFGLNGACLALVLSVLASLLASELRFKLKTSAKMIAPSADFAVMSVPPSMMLSQRPGAWVGNLMLPALLSQLSVIAFTQIDVIIVKAVTTPELAGAFAIIVLTGRIVSFTGQAVETPLLPAVVGRVARRQSAFSLLQAGMLGICVVTSPLLIASFWQPELFIGTVFGRQHVAAAPFLGGYALAMFVHTLSSLVIDYAFCHGLVRVTYAACAIGVGKVVCGVVLIRDLHSAVAVNVASSVLLLLVVSGLTVWTQGVKR